ncbi:MAG TPA: AraC family transcriptional regulator [Chitinophagaceae bacterium]|nr:AraC family transcriptional regulator [Chitinophagaceae bacterium]
MKPVPAIISPESIFFIRKIKQSHFSSEFHFHEECQLAWIIKGSGKRIVGDSVEHFDENELVFIGSNIPHVWYNTERKHVASKKTQSVSLSLFISPLRVMDHLRNFGDIERIKQLFLKAQRGMLITGENKLKLISLLKRAANENNSIEHIITLLKIIHLLSTTDEYTLLASSSYINNFQYRENERMNNVYGFLMKNFKKDIALSEVASVAAMNPNAFCRFFKSRTQKSLTQFINEIRIGHACKLLANPDESITQIAYKCGYNNVSNFNHFFKLIKKTSPRQYRKELELN